MLFFFTVLFMLWLAASAMAGEFTGQVVSVLDGDTIEVLHKKRPERIRLGGIDCPEKRPFGKRPRTPPPPWFLGRMSRFRCMARAKTGAP
jgi:endonuclease YncB( thermonuclease family)